MPWSLCLGGSCPWLKWLPACLEPRALLVGVSLCALVGVLGGGYLHALVVRALVVGVSLCALVVGRLVVGGYLCALELVLCWLVSLVGVVTCMP